MLKDINNKLKEIDSTFKVIGNSDKDIVYLKDEMKVCLEEVNLLPKAYQNLAEANLNIKRSIHY